MAGLGSVGAVTFPFIGQNPFGMSATQADRINGLPVEFRKAENLLTKAHRALATDDRERAAGYIDRAAHLPFDDFERHVPAIVAAEYLLYVALTDRMKDGPEGDESWLDDVQTVLESDSPARHELATTLRDALVEGATQRERRRAEQLLAPYPPVKTDWGPDSDLPHKQRVERINAILSAWVAYDAAAKSATRPGD